MEIQLDKLAKWIPIGALPKKIEHTKIKKTSKKVRRIEKNDLLKQKTNIQEQKVTRVAKKEKREKIRIQIPNNIAKPL